MLTWYYWCHAKWAYHSTLINSYLTTLVPLRWVEVTPVKPDALLSLMFLAAFHRVWSLLENASTSRLEHVPTLPFNI